nr:PREDICTED: uncharacterized protein LOC105673776 isoform X2 [Linepithema humile]
MESNKSKENHKASRRRSKKEEKREAEKLNSKSEESILWPYYSVTGAENTMNIMQQETSSNLNNLDNGNENNSKSSLMCPALRRQLETHKNILKLLHEHKLVSTQINGQRILSIQPIRWNGPTPGIECEIFVGRIPKTIYEDTLYPLFKEIGEIFQIRLMVDMAETTRGYCFIMYTNPKDAVHAIARLDEYEILPGRKIRVLATINKCKLYIGPLPWHIASEEVVKVIYASVWDIEYVSIYRFPNHDAAYAIVSFKSHRNAALARRKLRPAKLFKCNEVHVEWARVDWNPSNVYEDRGTVNDKGDVQITRRYLQPKRAVSLVSTQNKSNYNRKQITPICPPKSNGRVSPSKSAKCNGTRYSTMLTMSAMLDESRNNKLKVNTDINDNVQLLNEHCKDKMYWKNDADANSFPNFDMWNSNLVPSLPNSPTDSSSLKNYESLDKILNQSIYNWESSIKYVSPKTSSFNGYRYPNDPGVSDYCHPTYNYYLNKTVDQNQPISTGAVRYQTFPHQSRSSAPCYMLLQSQNNYLYSKNLMTYPQSSIVNRSDGYDQCAPLSANCSDHRSCFCNGQTSAHKPIGSSTVGKFNNCEFYGVTPAKVENETVAGSGPVNFTSSCNQNCASNFVLNFTPIYASSAASENATAPCAVSYNTASEKKRPKPILSHTNGHIS